MPVADTNVHADAAVTTAAAAVSVSVSDTPGDVAPYVTVWSIRGGMVDGSLGAPNDDVRFPVQLTCVGRTRNEAQALQAATRAHYLTVGNWSIVGRSVMRVSLESPSGVERDTDLGELPGQVRWFTSDVFHIHTTPA